MAFAKAPLTILLLSIFITCGCAYLPKKTTTSPGDTAFLEKYRLPDSANSESNNEIIDEVYLQNKADYHFTIGEAYSLENNSQRAIEEFRHTLVYDSKTPKVRMRLAAEYLKVGLLSEALEQAKEAVKLAPKTIDTHLLLAGLYSMLKMYEEATKEYQQVIAIDPNNGEAQLYIGALLAEQKKYGESEKFFLHLAHNRKFESRYLAYYYLGKVYLEQNTRASNQKATEVLKKCLDIKPDFTDGVLLLGSLYLSEKQNKKTLKLYATFQKQYGPNSLVAEALGSLYLDTEDYEKAYEQLEYIEKSDPSNLNVKMKMALILIEQKDYHKAITMFEQIIAIVADSDKVRFYLAAVYEETNQHNYAIENFLKIPPTSQFYGEAIIHAAYLKKTTGNLDDAIKLIQEGIENRDDIPQFYSLYASFLDEKKSYHTAVTMLSDVVKRFPNDAQLRFFLGSMYDRLGEIDLTVAEMKKVLEINGDHLQALNYLAYTYAEQGIHLNDATLMIKKALQQKPDDGYFLDTLGWIFLKQGKLRDAIKVLETAHKRVPSESIIAEHLGDAYYKYRLTEKAKNMYIKAAEIETDPQKLQKIKAKIITLESAPIMYRQPAAAQ